MRWILASAVAVGIGALVYVGTAWLLQRKMLYQPPPAAAVAAPPPGVEVISLQVGEVASEAWYLPPLRPAERPAPLLLFAHGNAEIIDPLVPMFESPRAQGMAALLVEYPGYGRSQGAPTERSIADAMVAAYDRMAEDPRIDGTRIVGYGRSLGVGAVGLLATRRPLAAMILQSGFVSVPALARRMLLPGFLARDRFDNASALRSTATPALIVHGERDAIVPVADAHLLHAAAERSELLLLACGHNDCPPEWEPFWERVRAFLSSHAVLP